MLRLLRLPAPGVPLSLRWLTRPSTLGPPCALQGPHEPIKSCLRQLKSSPLHDKRQPPNHSAEPRSAKMPIFPTTPLGLVDFIGFDGTGYRPGHLTKSMAEDRTNWRDTDFEAEKTAEETMKNASFQPLVKLVDEVTELELAGALLDYDRSRYLDRVGKIGIPRLHGGYEYIDKSSGEWMPFVTHLPPQDQDRVTITFGRPLFDKLRYRAQDAQRDDWDATEAELELVDWAATEAELDQVVCSSPYFKLQHYRHGEFQPEGSIHRQPHALPREQS